MNSTLHSRSLAPVQLVLDRHGVRRAAGLATVSVLVGPVGAALAEFRAWAGRHGHPSRARVATEVAEAVTLFARCAEEAHNLVDDAYSHLATHTGRPVAELRAALATGRDLDLFFAANDGRLPPGPGTRLARALCEAVPPGERAGRPWWSRGGAEPLVVLAGLAELTAIWGVPACVITPPPMGDAYAWLRAAGATLVAVATHVPRLPIAVAVPTAVWSRYLAEAPDGRCTAILREGVVELPFLGPADIERVLARPGAGSPPLPSAVLPVLAEGVPGTFATALAKATTAPRAAATADEDDAARSAAERFLYEFLEMLPATAGRFELNADAGFRFGPRAAEVDLLARDLRIAVEIDGYYHFRDEANYRRDRAKDWELQRHGFLVLRFLADDIIPRLEDVRDRILAAVALRTAGVSAC